MNLLLDSAQYFGSLDGFADAVRSTVPLREGVSVEEYLECPSCYFPTETEEEVWPYPSYDGTDAGTYTTTYTYPVFPEDGTDPITTIDNEAYIAALEELVIAPMESTQALFDDADYLTRLFTTLSPDEMRVDPEFLFNPDLEPVDNVHTRERYVTCDEDGNQSWEMDFDDTTLEGVDQNWPVAIGDLPANARVLQLSTSGPGEVVMDQTDTIDEMVDEMPTPTPGPNGMPGPSGGDPEGSDGGSADPDDDEDGEDTPRDDDASDVGRAGNSNASVDSDASDCGCRTVGGKPSPVGLTATLLIGSGMWVRRRGERRGRGGGRGHAAQGAAPSAYPVASPSRPEMSSTLVDQGARGGAGRSRHSPRGSAQERADARPWVKLDDMKRSLVTPAALLSGLLWVGCGREGETTRADEVGTGERDAMAMLDDAGAGDPSDAASGTNGSPPRSCVLQDDCCTCEALSEGASPAACEASCEQTTCQLWGVTASDIGVRVDVLGNPSCDFDLSTKRYCAPWHGIDTANVAFSTNATDACDGEPPDCEPGTVPELLMTDSALYSCWTGACVPAPLCHAVSDCRDCAPGDLCLIYVEAGMEWVPRDIDAGPGFDGPPTVRVQCVPAPQCDTAGCTCADLEAWCPDYTGRCGRGPLAWEPIDEGSAALAASSAEAFICDEYLD